MQRELHISVNVVDFEKGIPPLIQIREDLSDHEYTKREIERVEGSVKHHVISYLNNIADQGMAFPEDGAVVIHFVKVDQENKLLARRFDLLVLNIVFQEPPYV